MMNYLTLYHGYLTESLFSLRTEIGFQTKFCLNILTTEQSIEVSPEDCSDGVSSAFPEEMKSEHFFTKYV